MDEAKGVLQLQSRVPMPAVCAGNRAPSRLGGICVAAICTALLLVNTEALAGPQERDAGPGAGFAGVFGNDFLDAYWRLHPDDAISAGYYRAAEGLWIPDAKGRAELLSFLRESLARLQAMAPAAMDPAGRTDHAVLQNQLAGEIWELSEDRQWQWNPALYNVAQGFAILLNTEYAPLEQRLRTVLARIGKVPAFYAAARENLVDPTREHTQLAIEQNEGALELFGADLEKRIAGSGLAEDERARLRTGAAAARQAIEAYVAWLRARDRDFAQRPARSFRLGKALYEQKFGFAIASGESAAALYQRAQREKENLIARMDLLCDQLWPKVFPNAARPQDRFEKIGTLIGKLSEQHVARGEYFDEVRRLVPQMEQWIGDHDLITQDPTRPLRVRITPAYERGVTAASLEAPGPYDATAPTYFNVTPLDDRSPERAESFLREYNRWILPVLVMHEAVPGHYVQLLYSNKSPSLIKSLFGNGAMIEGWAVYAERLMVESGYGADSAEQWLMYYKFHLRSVCNTILDYAVHVLGMDEEQARRLLVHEAFQTPEQAREKWRRVQLTSVQLTSYFAGYSAIYEFRERRKKELGSRFDLKRFHERFLSYGSAPLAIIESLMQEDAGI